MEMKRFNAILPELTLDQMDEQAQREGVSRSRFIEKMFVGYLAGVQLGNLLKKAIQDAGVKADLLPEVHNGK